MSLGFSRISSCALPSALLLLSAAAPAQQPHGGRLDVWRTVASPAGYAGEVKLVDIEDLSGDGIPELLVIRVDQEVGGEEEAGVVDLLSGSDFSLLHSWAGTLEEERLGTSLTVVEDRDGDGLQDILFGRPGAHGFAGAVELVSSAPPYLSLREWVGEQPGDEFGASLDVIGDLDGDSQPEMVVGAEFFFVSGFGSVGKAYVYATDEAQATGLHLELEGQDFAQTTFGPEFGRRVLGVGDVSGDAVPDFLVAAPGSDDPFGGISYTEGEVFAFSGADGSLLYELEGGNDGGQFGSALARVGDLNSDGADEFLVGAPLDGGIVGYWPTGFASVHDGASGDELHVFFPEREHGLFGMAVSAGDLNLDGVPDLAVSAPSIARGATPNVGAFYVYSGADFSLLYQQFGPGQGSLSGIDIRIGADRTGDGVPEVSTWTFRPDGQTPEPTAVIHSGALVPQLSATASTLSRTNPQPVRFDLEFPSDAGFYWYQLLFSAAGQGPVSLNGLALPLSYDRFLVDAYAGTYATLFSGRQAGILSPQGDVSVTFAVAPNGIPAGLVGTTLYFAGIARVIWGDWEYASVSVPLTITP